MHEGVVSCPPETPLRGVAELMAARGIHAVVVYTEPDESQPTGRHWGVLSDLDLIASVEALETLTAGSAATTATVMIMPDESLRRAAALMNEYRTAHLIVVDPSTIKPIGVISSIDVARAIASSSPA